MASRSALWAQEVRRKLVQELGGKCARCGLTYNLELDHVNGREWEPADHNQWTRVARYRREAKEGKLRVL